jgi:hypothetical protein
MKNPASCISGSLVLLLVLVLAGCQAIFTYSPLSFLQRDPDNLPLDQKITWAENALASGDPEAMATAYDAIKDESGVDYLAANLALELSGVPQLLFEVIEGDIEINNQTDLENFLQDNVDGEYVTFAAGHFLDTLSNDPDSITSTDYVLGAASLLFKAAEENGGSMTGLDNTDALAFATAGLNTMSADDPAYEYMDQLKTFIAGL